MDWGHRKGKVNSQAGRRSPLSLSALGGVSEDEAGLLLTDCSSKNGKDIILLAGSR